MEYIIEKQIKSPKEIKKSLPLTKEMQEKIYLDRKEIINIIEGNDKRKLLIIGPCSAWPKEAVIEYAKKLKKFDEMFGDKIKFILRIYTQKPRTTIGWSGPANQPNPFEASNIELGIKYCREMMLEAIEIGLPIADEALFTHKVEYFEDLLSYVAIGARSSEDQEHRIYASMLKHPVGLKNPTSGNIEIGINSVISAQHSHVFLLSGAQIRTFGNQHAHIILRGGGAKSNLFYEDLKKTIELQKKLNIKYPSIIADVSHDNSIDPASGKKDYKRQNAVLNHVIDNMLKDKEINEKVKGFMVESFIKGGKQDLSLAKKIEDLDLEGLSITDPCIGIEDTEKLIINLYNRL